MFRALQRFPLAVRRVASPLHLPSRRFFLPIRGVSTVGDGWEGPSKHTLLRESARPGLDLKAFLVRRVRCSSQRRRRPKPAPLLGFVPLQGVLRSLFSRGQATYFEHRQTRTSPRILLLMTVPRLSDSPGWVNPWNDAPPDLLALGRSVASPVPSAV